MCAQSGVRPILFGLLLAASCGPQYVPSGATCPEGSTLTYANSGVVFMRNYCVACHSRNIRQNFRQGAPVGIDFDSVDEVRLHTKHIDEMAAAGPGRTNTLMPRIEPHPSLEERLRLGEWLACGAPP